MSVTDESSGSLNRQTDLPSSHESEDAGRIQQWIDCSEWDVFEAKFPPNDDIHICQRALETGFILPFRNALVPGGQNDDAEVGRPGNSETGEAASVSLEYWVSVAMELCLPPKIVDWEFRSL
jgi:hypothetical protein